MRKIIPFQSNHCLSHISFIRPDDVNNQLIVRDYMPNAYEDFAGAELYGFA